MVNTIFTNSEIRIDDPAIERWLSSVDKLPSGDYVSPNLKIVIPDPAFPEMIIGNEKVQLWPYLRREITHNWYVDRRNPTVGFLDRDEAAILFNSALMFQGAPCLEVGCWRGWSSAHIALGSGNLEIIDPVLKDDIFAADVRSSLTRAGVGDRVTFHPHNSPDAMRAIAEASNKRWSFIFIDGDHEGDAPLRDAQAAMDVTTPTAMIMFHDLASPHVANGLLYLREQGWSTCIYHTKQIMGAAWRGSVEPIVHTRNPDQKWTLPDHLAPWAGDGGFDRPVDVSSGRSRIGKVAQSELNAVVELTQLVRELQDERQAHLSRLKHTEDALEAAQQAHAAELQGNIGRLSEVEAALAGSEEALSALRAANDEANTQAEHAAHEARKALEDLASARGEMDALAQESARQIAHANNEANAYRAAAEEQGVKLVEAASLIETLETRISDLSSDLRMHNEVIAQLADVTDLAAKQAELALKFEGQYADVSRILEATLLQRDAEARRALGARLRAELAEEAQRSLEEEVAALRDAARVAEAKSESIWGERIWFEGQVVLERQRADEMAESLKLAMAAYSDAQNEKEAAQDQVVLERRRADEMAESLLLARAAYSDAQNEKEAGLRTLRAVEAERNRLLEKLAAEHAHANAITNTLDAVRTSTSWRLGAPLRAILDRLRRR